MFLLAGAMTVPRTLWAEQKATPVIGFLSATSPGPNAPFVAAFRQGLRETGYFPLASHWRASSYAQQPEGLTGAGTTQHYSARVSAVRARYHNASALSF
jgi:hypothetical protein